MYDFDTTKLAVNTLDVGLAGIEVYDILRDFYDIQTEFGDLGNLLAYVSVGDRAARPRTSGERALRGHPPPLRAARTRPTLMRQEYIVAAGGRLGPQEAFYADKKAHAAAPGVESDASAAEFVMCYPPGIPILAPG